MIQRIRQKFRDVPEAVKASTAYTICSIAQRCLSLITMPLFTRILTTQQYGQYGVYQAWSGILTIFLTLNLASGSFPTAMIRFEGDRRGYIAAVQNIGVMLTAVFFALYLPFRDHWNSWLGLPTPLVCVMAVEILANLATACWYSSQHFSYKYKRVVAVTLLMAVSAPIAAYILVMNSEEPGYARTVGYASVNILLGTCFFIYGAFGGKGGWNKTYWKYALSFNIPLIPYFLSQVIFNQSDRIMIDHYCGTDKAGMYGIAYTLGTVLTFVLNAVNNSYVPWLYRKIKEGKGRESRKMADGIALLLAFLLLGVIALAPEVIFVLAGKAFYEAIWVVPPVTMSLLLLFYSQLFLNISFFYEEKKMLVWGSVGAAVLNVALNAWLIPRLGFVVAGYTTLVSYVIFAFFNYCSMKSVCRKKNLRCDFYDLKTLMLIFAVFAVLTFVVMALYGNRYLRYGLIAAVLLLLGVFHKKTVAMLRMLTTKD